ncbi:tryptophan synthase subunit alpha [Puteibacter caeruleilacunae]|nr:tryptophan synthase subunit alpha [Puteibacter caeruleilacunae]
MNRINQLFENKKNNILTVYFTAGFPELNDTLTILKSAEEAGADIVEIGMPFSDPLADGPTIQASGDKALENGMSIAKLFEQLKDMRKEISIPVLLMGYLNPVHRYGWDKFLQQCEYCGIDGLILPDLPIEEYKSDFKDKFEKIGLSNVFLITPQTPNERIRMIDELSTGFIYMVSSASTTGAKSGITEEQEAYFNRIAQMELKSPVQIGFGISDRGSFNRACEFADGAIIGSAFIKAIQKSGSIDVNVKNFISSIK